MKKHLIIFDLDGTLMDTSEGIINCYHFAADYFGYQRRSNNMFRGVIGGPLLQNFQTYYGMDENTARQAVEIYRSQYAMQGILQAQVYEGMEDLLHFLKDKGQFLAVATLKREDFARKMLKHFQLEQYFDVICGIDQYDTQTKADLIRYCMNALQVKKTNSILIGDSIHDEQGAKQTGIPFIGVSYGWGFDTTSEIDQGYHIASADSVAALGQILQTILG